MHKQDSLSTDIEKILSSVSRLTGVGVCIYDLKNLLSTDDPQSIENSFKNHFCSFCHIVRGLDGGRDACIKSDVYEAVHLGELYKKPFFHTCHAGIIEIVVPIIYKESMIAIVFIGQCILEGETKLDTVYGKIEKFGAKKEDVEEYFTTLPVIDRSRIMSAATLLNMSFKHILEEKGRNAFDMYFYESNENHVTSALNFISNYYCEGIKSKDVCDHVHLNSSYFCRLFKKTTGQIITDYLNTFRIEKAKNMLKMTDLPVNSIAINVGYSEQNYFSRTFSRITGLSPMEYRKTMGRGDR